LKVLGTQTNIVTCRLFSTAPKGSTSTVKATDGIPDDLLKQELHHVEEIADYAAEMERVKLINKNELDAATEAEAKKIFAVEAPDGTSDELLQVEMHEVEEIIDFAAAHEDVEMIKKKHEVEAAAQAEARKIFAVEAPDGTSDELMQVEMHEVEEIIDYAADHEDVAKIKKRRENEEAVRKEQARDPEHDW
jgi:uncharacterized protein (DUF433 family)